MRSARRVGSPRGSPRSGTAGTINAALAIVPAVFFIVETLASQEKTHFVRHEVNPSSTYSAAAAFDVDGDGDKDIVSGGWWYEAPTWKPHFLRDVETIRGRFDDYSNLPIDVNGDGRLDLVSANYRSGKLYWIEQPASGGSKTSRWTSHLIAEAGPMETARLVDIDGDGRVDVLPNGVRSAAWWEIVPSDGKGVRWIRHDLPREAAGHGVGFGDIDGDGRGDIVSPRGWLQAPEDRREGEWTWRQEFELDRDGAIPILVLDVDGDGDRDIVWARGHRFGVYWLEQLRDANSRRRWVRHAIDTSVSQMHSLLVCDLDGDGHAEVVAGKRFMGHDGKDPGEYDPLVVYSYQYLPASRTWRRLPVSWGGGVGFGLDPKAIDLDDDGDVDLVCPGRSGLYWLENRRIASKSSPAGAMAFGVSAPSYADHSDLLVVSDRNGQPQRVVTPGQWARRRSHVLAGLELAMGELPGPERRVPLDVELAEAVRTARYIRQKLSFAAEPGDRVPAWLLTPLSALEPSSGKAPAMLCLHQTTAIGKDEPAGLGGLPRLRYAHELAERGFVCLVPDYPSFGEYPYDFRAGKRRHASGSMKAIWNNIRAVDLLESLAVVDRDRIGVIGHSLGGHNAIFTSVFDQRLRVVVSSCGFTPFHDYYGGRINGWTSDRYMPRLREVYGNDPDRVPFDFHELVAALAPRAFFVNAPLRDRNFDVTGVRKAIQAASRIYALRGASHRLVARYPDCGHDFPDEVRDECYRFLDSCLGNETSKR